MLLAAAGCSGSDASAGPASYLAVDGSKVAFIQWRTASHGHLHGMITEGSIGGSGSAQKLSVASAPFTGTMTGNSVKLTFAELYFLRAHAHGTVSGSALTMAVPQADGTINRTTFSQSDQASYDRAIAALRTKVRRATLVAARQQASSGGQSTHAQAERSAQSSLNALYADSSLAHDGRLADGLAHLAAVIEVARTHLTAEKQDALGSNKYCSAAFTVTGDSEAIGGALQHAQGAVLALMAQVAVVRHDIAISTAYLRHLNRSGLPAPSNASNVIAGANASLRQAIATANSYIAEINAIEVRARSLADNMAVRKCSGARSGASPHPIPPVGTP